MLTTGGKAEKMGKGTVRRVLEPASHTSGPTLPCCTASPFLLPPLSLVLCLCFSHFSLSCWEPPGCTQVVTRSWDKRGTCKAALPHMGLPRGPNMSPPEPPGQEGNLQGSSSPRGYPGDKVTGLIKESAGQLFPSRWSRG